MILSEFILQAWHICNMSSIPKLRDAFGEDIPKTKSKGKYVV